MIASNDHKQHLKEVMTAFWDEQFRIEESAQGLIMTLPLLDATGWQLVIHLNPLAPNDWELTDQGEILGGLDDAGKNLQAQNLREIIDSRCDFYQMERDGLILKKKVRYPLDPSEIQLFAEGMVAISHLRPYSTKEVAINPVYRMETRMSEYFERKRLPIQRRYKISGHIEKEVQVEFYTNTNRPLAVQPVGRNRQMLPYMEQWGWRWTDLNRAHPDLIKAMVFDPDNQIWDSASLRIGESVCDIFVPYSEAEAALDEVLVS